MRWRFAAICLLAAFTCSGGVTQSTDSAKLRDSYLMQAGEAARQIRDTRDRVYALTQVATALHRYGHSTEARAAYLEAFSQFDAMPVADSQKQGLAMLFLDDTEIMERVAQRITDARFRDRMYEMTLRRVGRRWETKGTEDLLAKIQSQETRERTLLHLLQASRGSCDGAAVNEIPPRLELPQFRAQALVVLAECARRKKAPSATLYAEAIDLAMKVKSDPRARAPFRTEADPCDRASGYAEGDWALYRIASSQASGGLTQSAIKTVSRIEDATARANAHAMLAGLLARLKQFDDAMAVVGGLPSEGCRAAAFQEIAPSLWASGSELEAMRVIPSAEYPGPRAYALADVASRQVLAKRLDEARALLLDAAEAALRIKDYQDRLGATLYVAAVQRKVDAADSVVTLTRLISALQDWRKQEPNRWPPTAGSIGASLAQAGAFEQALALISELSASYRAPAMRRVAEVSVKSGLAPHVVAWLAGISDPFEKCFAFLGIAHGLGGAGFPME